MNPLRTAVSKNISSRLSTRTLAASGSILGATRVVRPSLMQQSRGYAAETASKKGGNGGFIFLSKFPLSRCCRQKKKKEKLTNCF